MADEGVIPRAITDIFKIIEEKKIENPNTAYEVSVNFIELYGENIRNLLDESKEPT